MIYEEHEILTLSGLSIDKAIEYLKELKNKYPEEAYLFISSQAWEEYGEIYSDVTYEINYEREETPEELQERKIVEDLTTRQDAFCVGCSNLGLLPNTGSYKLLERLREAYHSGLYSDTIIKKMEELFEKYSIDKEV